MRITKEKCKKEMQHFIIYYRLMALEWHVQGLFACSQSKQIRKSNELHYQPVCNNLPPQILVLAFRHGSAQCFCLPRTSLLERLNVEIYFPKKLKLFKSFFYFYFFLLQVRVINNRKTECKTNININPYICKVAEKFL